jgi:predicted phosphoadenosine phosphosulfate sulfurtransferase
VVEPETWAKVVNRVSGVNFGNIYCGTKALGYHQVKLPEGHTWQSYTKLLLESLPPETRANYMDRFDKFMKYWMEEGSAVPDDMIDKLPSSAVITDKISNRSKGKRVVKYRYLEDFLDSELETHRLAPTWRRMAICILKNDHLCKGLSFTQTKNQTERMKQLVKKYRNILEGKDDV